MYIDIASAVFHIKRESGDEVQTQHQHQHFDMLLSSFRILEIIDNRKKITKKFLVKTGFTFFVWTKFTFSN